MSTNGKRLFIARHGETVFNAVARMQGQQAVHTPLTRAGFLQADAMGRALAPWFEGKPTPILWSSTAGRALQTLAIVAEHVGADWHQTKADDRLQEIDVGDWSERTYADIHAEIGPFVDHEEGLFTVQPPNGEWYDDIAHRLNDWIADATAEPGDAIVLRAVGCVVLALDRLDRRCHCRARRCYRPDARYVGAGAARDIARA